MRPTPIRLLRLASYAALAATVFLAASCGGGEPSDGGGDPADAAAGTDAAAGESGTGDDPTTGTDADAGTDPVAVDGAEDGAAVEGDVEVKIEVRKEGEGEELTDSKVALVEYSGYLWPSGKMFDSSRKEGRDTFRVDMARPQVIQGWIDGLKGMKVGEERVLTIPPELGYGKAGSGANIPPDSTLVFYVELVGVEPSPNAGGGN